MAEGSDEVSSEIERLCGPCLKNGTSRTAVVFCVECQEFQCQFCVDVHKRFALMKDHVFSNLSDSVSDDAYKNCVDMKGHDYCDKHKKRYKFFCDNEKVLACSTCAIVIHTKCKKMVEIENIKDAGRCNELSRMLRIAITERKTAIENIKEAELCISYDVKDVEQKLSNLKTQILQSFDDFARKVTQQAKTYRDGEKAEWASKKVECETKIKAMSTTLKTMDDIIEHGTPSQRFIASHSMDRSIQNEIREHNSVCEDLKKLAVSLKFNENFEHFKNDLMGQLKPDQFELTYSVPRKSTLTQIASVDLGQTDDDVGETRYSGLDFLADGTVVATDNENGKVVTYDTNLKLLSTFKLPYNHPLCVAAVAGDKVIITSGGNCRLDLLRVSQSHTMTLNRTVKVNVQYDSISMMNDNEAVVSTIDHDTPVRILSMSGEEKDIDIAFPSKKYQVDKSSSAYIRGKHKLVLTDRDEDTVFIYDMESGERIVVKHELIKKPLGVAVGPYDHVFVGSYSATTSIVEMTHTGHVLSSIDVGMFAPRTICISRDSKLLAIAGGVVGNQKLKTFQLV